MEIEIPAVESIRAAVARYDADPRTSLADRTLKLVFEAHPRNTDEALVLQKVATLNALYSTQIYDVIRVARHIVALDIDQSLAAGSIQIVPKIAAVQFEGKSRTFYSFATKYCSWHNPEAFPIFDDYVGKRLVAYRKAFKFSKFTALGLRDYPRFVDVLKAFQDRFGLAKAPLRDVDKFLWLEGKRHAKASEKIGFARSAGG